MRRNRNLWWGTVLIVLGVILLMDNANFMDFGELVHTWWPLLLVLLGVSMLIRRSRISSPPPESGAPSPEPMAGCVKEVFKDRSDAPGSDSFEYSTVFGDLALRPVSANFKMGLASAVFGDTTIDLTSAGLSDGDSKLKLSGVFGDVSIMLAPSMAYVLSSNSVFGTIQAAGQKRDGFSSHLVVQSPEFSTSSKRLSIDVSQVFGDITLTR